ncbi:hypothetical protein [Streptomyces sp. NPDC059063]|uniref:hypothetical protein n=1 Tax=Streptomyces sp. NPDC059063 TaxID=3346712 RepID=UPI0036C60222
MFTDLFPPPRLARRPRDRHGRLVPWFVAYIDGEPDHRVVKEGAVEDAARFRICFLCGGGLGAHHTFVLGPMCTINRVSAEPPSHRDCADYAVRSCPFLTHPQMRRRDNTLPAGVREPDGIMCRRNPGVCAVWTTRAWSKRSDAWLFDLGDPLHVTWWSRGRRATHEEALDALVSGRTVLEDEADEDAMPARAHRLLARQYERALTCLPGNVPC